MIRWEAFGIRARALVIAVAAAIAVPGGTLASQIVLPGLVEEVVEGHTVFALLEKARFTNVTREVAAVAVLIRERLVARENFKGVEWFNAQYLVSPYVNDAPVTRFPCGGAVLAVNAGDPDPRTMLASYDQSDQLQEFFNDPSDPYDVLAQEDASYENPDPLVYEQSGDYTLLGLYHDREYDSPVAIDDAGTPGSTPGAFQPKANSWVDYDETANRVTTSTVTGVLNYVESYLVTDPNDHAWIIDKYNGISTVSLDLSAPGSAAITTSTFPVWAVNILGKPAFTPDDGIVSCTPFVDDPWQQSHVHRAFITADAAVCGVTSATPLPDSCPSDAPGLGVDTDGDGFPVDGLDAKPPAIGYYEPTDPATNGGATYCYDGNAPQGANVGRSPGTGCLHGGAGLNPLRQYNAVLEFFLGPEDAYVTGSAAHAADETNGCESAGTYNGLYGPVPKASTEWLCPLGDDSKEGNSHPFNPPGVYVPTVFDPTTGAPIAGTGEWYDVWSFNRECANGYDEYPVLPLELDTPPKNSCDSFDHDAHNRGVIDLYYSNTARPMEPLVRVFAILDYEGRTDEFHENNGDPGTAPSPDHPGTPDFDPLPATYLADS